MANNDHLTRLKQGVEVWNQWRQEHPDILPDLSGAFLGGAQLSGALLSGVQLDKADLSGADLHCTNLILARLQNADLRGAILYSANLYKADLSFAIFWESDLHDAKFDSADLSGSALGGVNLSGANLRRANLFAASLRGADLRRADLREADLHGSSLDEADLGGAHVGWTVFGAIDLRSVKGLETVLHHGPSTIGVDTILTSQGKVPEIFLRGAGLPEEFIVYVPSLVGRPIEYYSCFISYSSKDQPFAERLYADLQSKGVRCWYAPEDLKIGERIRVGIDESIRRHDKLLLVLSQHSVASDWVEKEVETAMEQERNHKRTVLFPVRLDTTVMKIESGWPADIRRTRNIGNFQGWKDHDIYQQAFDRLLRDLKTDEAREAEAVVPTSR